VRDRITKLGIDPVTTDPARFAQFMRDETGKWSRVITQAGIKIE
jgi:tripartite-type tricarboxylate transporter receptor subunit TctC